MILQMQSVISLFHITHFYVHDSKINIMDQMEHWARVKTQF